ncbi:hypothetical protein C8Q76DRAFT_391695 [Earliella scabrosa]|nr:hypothetical protein C8Q76DRAFT_391695 [Earliella scabrosa]
MPDDHSDSHINAIRQLEESLPSYQHRPPGNAQSPPETPHASTRQPQLRVTGEGNVGPLEVGPFQGLVAAPGFSFTSAFTTPNTTWIPRFAIARSEITTYTDGRWGRHEYSRWPQEFTREAFHIHCIPMLPSSSHLSADPSNVPGEVLWRTLQPSTDWTAVNCGAGLGVGSLTPTLELELAREVSKAIAKFRKCAKRDGWTDIGIYLTIDVQHTLDRMRALPAVRGIIIALAAHVQRLTLELWGMVNWLDVVLPRTQSMQDCRAHVLEVLGAHTSDPSVAQMLHYAGLPLWFQQLITNRLVVYKVSEPTDLPSDFSTIASYPRMVLANRDLSGALNLPGAWRWAMLATVRRQLCHSRLPDLVCDEKHNEVPSSKRLRTLLADDAPSFIGSAAAAVHLTKVKPLDYAHSLRHPLRVTGTGTPPRQSARWGREQRKRAPVEQAPTAARPADVSLLQPQLQSTHPSRKFCPSHSLTEPMAWSTALHKASPLPQPDTSPKYYFAPPWMLDSSLQHNGHEGSSTKTIRYMLQWLSIRTFCRVRLFDHTVAGQPLAILEWRDSLWGNYKGVVDAGSMGRQGTRHQQQLNTSIRSLLGKVHHLPSYHDGLRPSFGKAAITQEVLEADRRVRARIIWDVYEINWRCELLALDALMVGSSEWSELDRWVRESLVAKIWGGTSGMDIVPDEDQEPVVCWRAPPEAGWTECGQYLQAFVDVVQRWPGCPEALLSVQVAKLNEVAFTRVLHILVDFYVSAFVTKYHRLPVPPVRLPSTSVV